MPKQTSLRKNVVFNILGMSFPLVLAILAVPLIINGLGVVKFGLLTICWAILGYFSFLDFGVSRSLTNTVARCRGQDQLQEAWVSCWTAVVSLAVVFVPIGIVVYIFREGLADIVLNSPDDLREDVITSIGLIGLSLPIVVLTGVFKGALEGFERFDITNLIRLPMAIWSYAGPVLLLPFSKNIVNVVLFLMVGRFITMLLFAASLYRLKNTTPLHFSKASLKNLFTTGGWIGLSTFMSPLMIFVDRFVLAAKIALEKVAYYTTPMDAVTKLLQPVDAVAGVFFPALSRLAMDNKNEFMHLYRLLAEILSLLLLPCCLIIGVFSSELISLWISNEFAANSTAVLSILSVGVFSNGVARAPWMALQANGKAKFTAQLQIYELLPYGIALYFATHEGGVVGAALVWSVRVSIDSAILLLAASYKQVLKTTAAYWVSLVLLVVLCGFSPSLWLKSIVVIACCFYCFYRACRLFGVGSPSQIKLKINTLKNLRFTNVSD